MRILTLLILMAIVCLAPISHAQSDSDIPPYATAIGETLQLTPEFSATVLWAAADEERVLIGLELRHTTLDVMGYVFKSELRASTQYAILPTAPDIGDWEITLPQPEDRPSIARFALAFAPPRLPNSHEPVDFRLKMTFVASLSTAQGFGDMLMTNPNYQRAEGEFLFALPIAAAQHWFGEQTVESAGGQLMLKMVSHAPSGTVAKVCWLPVFNSANLEIQPEITPETTAEPIPAPICHTLSVEAVYNSENGDLHLTLNEFPLDKRDANKRILGPWVFEVRVE